jgi:hypothetical protein
LLWSGKRYYCDVVFFSLKCQNSVSDLIQCYCAECVCLSPYECLQKYVLYILLHTFLKWLVTFFFFLLHLILWVNIQLNMHFYIFFQITIYSDGSLADEIKWKNYLNSQTEQLKFLWIISKKFTLVPRFLICVYNWPIQMTKEKKLVFHIWYCF